MKALSFSQPWLWAMLHADKRIENRSWAPPIDMIGQRFALHAASSWDAKPAYVVGDDRMTPIGFLLRHGFDPPARRAVYDTGVIVATAVLDRVVTVSDRLPDDQKRWFFGPYGWVLNDLHVITVPVVATGKLGLWTVPTEMASALEVAP